MQEPLKDILPQIPTIEAAAKEYVTARNTRMELTKREVETRTVLIGAMKEASLTSYRTVDGYECTLTTTEKIKVKGAADDTEE